MIFKHYAKVMFIYGAKTQTRAIWGNIEGIRKRYLVCSTKVYCVRIASYAYFSVSSLHISDVVPYREMRASAAKDKSACGCINTNLSFQEQHLKVFL